MSVGIIQLNQCMQDTGLGTSTFTVPADGVYTVQVYYTIPFDGTGGFQGTPPGSDLHIQVSLNMSVKYDIGFDGSNYGPALGGSVNIKAAAGDTITVFLESDSTADTQLNRVKGFINVFQTAQF